MTTELKEQNPKESKKFLSKKIFGIVPVISLIGLILGIAGGYLYYSEIGCVNGSCSITSNPWLSMLWGGAMGFLLFDMFSRKSKDRKES